MPVLASELMELNMGPQHPSTHGVLRLRLLLDGERIVECDPVIGYLHRGTEKLAEEKDFRQAVYYTDRTDYVAAAHGNLAWCETAEKLMGIAVPRRAQFLRVVYTELSRISSHLLWLATHALDIGAMTVFLYCFREREKILDMFTEFCGARLTLNIFRIGGFYQDMTAPMEQRIREFCREFPGYVDEYETLLSKNRIWLRRTKGVGVLTKEQCIALGLSGPVARASGLDWDLRKTNPYEVYSELDFKVPVFTEGDTYARYLQRLEEMRQCVRIIEQALDKMPEEGPLMAPENEKASKPMKPPAGEIYHKVESPKGELGIYVVTDGKLKPARWKMRSPCFCNLQALPVMAKGHLVADVVAIIGTLDPVFGEVDR
jgi:NADH-quinone oxidoreductase subunit D